MRMLVFWCLDSDAFTRLFSVFDWRKILAACSMLVRSGGAGMGNAESAAGDFLAVEMCILPWQDGALVAGMVWFWRSKDLAFILILIPSWVVSRLLPFGREEEESSTRSTESTTTGQQLSFWRDSLFTGSVQSVSGSLLPLPFLDIRIWHAKEAEQPFLGKTMHRSCYKFCIHRLKEQSSLSGANRPNIEIIVPTY